MNRLLTDLLESTGGALTIEEILGNFGIACFLGVLACISYRFSHSDVVYSQRFATTLLMLAVTTTMVMIAIGHNFALSLGLVGALSIMRFRSVIKNVRDAVYIFWCLAIGICCGASEYYVPAIGTGVLFVAMLVVGAIKTNNRYILIVHVLRESEANVLREVNAFFNGRARLRSQNPTRDMVEIIYELPCSLVKDRPDGQNVHSVIMATDGVQQVNLIMQSEEVAK